MILPSPPRFSPCLGVLPAAQIALWSELHETPEHFTLYGGTAIALRLGHRKSIDFDFFTATPFNPHELLSSVSYLQDAEPFQVAPNSLGCRVYREGAPVQLSFFAPKDFPRLAPSELTEDTGLPVAALRDLAVSKLTVIQQRAEKKDYLDLHALLHQADMNLDDMMLDAHRAYGTRFAPLASLQALSYFDDGDVASLPDEMKRDLESAVDAVSLEHLNEQIHRLEQEPEIEP